MTPTFLISIDTGSDTDLLTVAQEIHDALDDSFSVISVKPWQQATTTLATPILSPEQNKQQTT